jgi:hypothetical protein
LKNKKNLSISLAPLDVEQALGALLATQPPEDSRRRRKAQTGRKEPKRAARKLKAAK